MRDIETLLSYILSAVYGRDVRQAIHDAIKYTYVEVRNWRDLRDGTVDTAALANLSVTEPKLADNAVSTRTIIDGSVTANKLSSGLSNDLRLMQQEINTLNRGGLIINEPLVAHLIRAWLDEHPEATTTVQDGAITDAKLIQNGGILERVNTFIASKVTSNDIDEIVDTVDVCS